MAVISLGLRGMCGKRDISSKAIATGNAGKRRTSAPAVTIFRTASDVRARRSPITRLDKIPLMDCTRR